MPEVGLHHLAARRAPVPYGDIQSSDHGIAKVAYSVGLMCSEVGRINTVKIIECERGKIRALGGGHVEFSRLEPSHRGANIWVPALRCLNKLFKAHQGRRKLGIIDQSEVEIEVGKEKHGQLKPALVHGELG